jgi:hypothetical protein
MVQDVKTRPTEAWELPDKPSDYQILNDCVPWSNLVNSWVKHVRLNVAADWSALLLRIR